MATDPRNDIVSQQYEKWVYPAPIADIPAWLTNNWQWFDPSHAWQMFWPNRETSTSLDILVAGCGTNQAAVLAYTNPHSRVTAIDVSESSLAHHRFLAEKYGLTNLSTHLLPIEEVQELGKTFDLIISTGVLHHLADPVVGAQALAECLRADGVLALMLYARYGRLGVGILQSVLQELGARQDEESIELVRELLRHVNESHPINGYLSIAPDLADNAGIVDTFLHGREMTYSIDECRELAEAAGLVFQDLFLKAPYYPHNPSTSPLLTSIASQPEQAQWSIMERINTRNGCHFFTACHKDRPRETYAIDFASMDAPNFIPSFRHRCWLAGDSLRRYNWQMRLTPSQAQLAAGIDGRTSIGEIVTRMGTRNSGEERGLASYEAGVVLSEAVEFFRSIWQYDFVSMRLDNAVGSRYGHVE